ncbi:hypothetical protein HPY42_02280 [Coprothermobacteraceae bacterium]|nr:hypothetical protein [Coprothermobacteraceae bacterium]
MKNITLAAVTLLMILGTPFSWAGAQIDRAALARFNSDVPAKVTVSVDVEKLQKANYPGFEALALRYMYLKGDKTVFWNACQGGAADSVFVSVRLYCYDVAWDFDRSTAIQMGSKERFYYYDLYVYEKDPREHLTRVMLTAWRNGLAMKQAFELARALNLNDVASLYGRASQNAAH